VRAFAGLANTTGTEPNPIGPKKGIKRHLVTDGQGVPLVVQIGPANRRDELVVAGSVVVAVDRGLHLGRRLPREFLADRGYGFAWSIALVLGPGACSAVAERGSPHGSGLGRRRYVVERTHSWFMRFRPAVTSVRALPQHIIRVFYQLAACVICAPPLAQRPPRQRKLAAFREIGCLGF